MVTVVTGAFSYIGRYIAQKLIERGERVRTLTSHPNRTSLLGETIEAFPYSFDQPAELIAHLRGASTLYNTYWVRFERGGATFQNAVANTRVLFESAKKAGIERIVHISVTHATDSHLPYYVGKAQQESDLARCGVRYSLVRPTLVFGQGDILVNNIVWLMRKIPVFPIFGSGAYHVQPVYLEDLASIAIDSAKCSDCVTLDAIGPEDWTFRDFVHFIASQIKPEERLITVPPAAGIALGHLLGLAVRDVILTRDELRGLMDNLLTSEQAPNGMTRFSEWMAQNKNHVGLQYASELARHFR